MYENWPQRETRAWRCLVPRSVEAQLYYIKCLYTDNIACVADNIAGSSCLSAAPTLLCPANSTHSRHHTSDWPKIIASWSNMKVPEKLFLCTGSCAVSLLLQISFIVSEFRSILRGGILIFSPSHISIRGYFAVTVLSVFKAYPRTVFGPTALVALDSPACFLSLRFRRNHQTPAVR